MQSFKKEERLCSRKNLNLLFTKGSSFLLYPFRVSCLLIEPMAGVPVQVVFNVPKKRYKLAVQRNLAKRRIREVYRLSKADGLYKSLDPGKLLLLSVQYVGKDIYPVEFLDKKMQLVFTRLISTLKNDLDK